MEPRIISRHRVAWVVLPIAACMAFTLAPRHFTLAQQPKPASAPSPVPKQMLRAELIQLGAEVEILQLEQDADRAVVLDLMKQSRDLAHGDDGAPTATKKEIEEARKAIAEEAKKSKDTTAANLVNPLLSMAIMMEEQRSAATAGVARAKASYAKRAAALVAKRLDFADAERRYRHVP